MVVMPPNQDARHDDFLRLFTVCEPALRAFVRSLVPRREDVPEVMQEVAVVLWRKFGDLADPGDFRKWAFGVARLEALAWICDKARDRHHPHRQSRLTRLGRLKGEASQSSIIASVSDNVVDVDFHRFYGVVARAGQTRCTAWPSSRCRNLPASQPKGKALEVLQPG